MPLKPRLLVDEGDAFIHVRVLRGILNASHEREDAFVTRTVAMSDDHEPRSFSMWAAKAIALIGRLPDTLEDRSLNVSMRRRARDEQVERRLPRKGQGGLEELCQKAAWSLRARARRVWHQEPDRVGA